MINEQLMGYVRQQLQSGVSKENIRASAAQSGWTTADIDEAFSAIERPAASIVSPSSASPAQPAAASISAGTAAAPAHKKKGLLLASLALLILFVGAGSAFASTAVRSYVWRTLGMAEAKAPPQTDVQATASTSTATGAQNSAAVATSSPGCTSPNPDGFMVDGRTIVSGCKNPPVGYLIPAANSIPSTYVKFIQTNRDDQYAIQYNSGENRYIVFEIAETATTSCASLVATNKSYYKNLTEKPFTFQNLSGTVLSISDKGSYGTDLFLSDSGKCLSISNSTQGSASVSADGIIAILHTFVRQPAWTDSPQPSVAPSASQISIPVTPYTVYLGMAKTLQSATSTPPDGEEAVVGYEWQSLPGGSKFTSLVVPLWAAAGNSDGPYDVSYWDGTEYKSLGQFTSLHPVVFPQGGVSRFKVTGLSPTFRICASSRNTTWGVTLASPQIINAVRTPITVPLAAGQSCEPDY